MRIARKIKVKKKYSKINEERDRRIIRCIKMNRINKKKFSYVIKFVIGSLLRRNKSDNVFNKSQFIFLKEIIRKITKYYCNEKP